MPVDVTPQKNQPSKRASPLSMALQQRSASNSTPTPSHIRPPITGGNRTRPSALLQRMAGGCGELRYRAERGVDQAVGLARLVDPQARQRALPVRRQAHAPEAGGHDDEEVRTALAVRDLGRQQLGVTLGA